MGYLEVTRLHESLWIHWYGVEDMYAWQQLNGLPRDKYLIQSGSVTVEQVEGDLLLYCTVYALDENGKPLPDPHSPREPLVRSIAIPYKEPIPEGIGKLVDWDFKLPTKKPLLQDDAA